MLSGIEFDYATFACGECRDNIDNRPVAGILPSLVASWTSAICAATKKLPGNG
ncbi:MAG: hypothetical protein KKB66_18275 [Alphaproteobacteria bacterium]|nr:hypothetical protein [Alphaproteobacteria bacterium]MBU0803550.1 hypothetical protein [Alphaproteobacteria bacterium]MBU1402478.1 hypothetical protein [Alphaproteobacteria bacterium]MBU1593119.1 hypothetical protein [Alphaproteobacteria bacterium]MBU1788988.1 hypothetical protein [Alphaproteobacteria bacterium]